MEPVHAQCLTAHQSKIYHLEVVQRFWSTDISLSVFSLCAHDRVFLIFGVFHISQTCKYALQVRLALLGVSRRWQYDLSRHFILICLFEVNIVCYRSFFLWMICVLRTCRHRLWPTLAMWYFCPYNPTSLRVSCTHGRVGYQCVGLQCTLMVSQRWVFPSLTIFVYSCNWDLLCFNLFLSLSLILLICGFL